SSTSPYQWPLHAVDKVRLTLGLSRNAALGPEFGLDPKHLAMTIQAHSRTRLSIEIENAQKRPWKVPHAVVPRHSPPKRPLDRIPANQQLDYTVVWEDPESFGFTVFRTSTNEKIFDTAGLGLTMKDQYLELTTRLIEGNLPANLYGLGENTGPFRREPGTTTTHWARDCPCTPHRNLYGSHPFYMQVLPSGRAHGVLLLSSNGMDVVFSSAGDRLTYKVIGGAIELYLMTGPSPQQVIQQYTELIGRPCMIPYFTLGFHMCRWGYDTLNKVQTVVAEFKRNALPLEAIWIDIDYMQDYRCFTFDQDRFPVKGLAAFADRLHTQDQHLVMILDPGIKLQYRSGLYEPYDEGVAKNIFIKRPVTEYEEAEDRAKFHAGDCVDFVGKVWPGKTVFPDWFHPETQAYWTKHITEWLQQVPLDGIWIDMNEAASFHDGDCSHIESSEDRPVRLSDFAAPKPTSSNEQNERSDSSREPQHVHVHAQRQNVEKKRKHPDAHSGHSKRSHHDDIQPKEAIAIQERMYEEENDPRAHKRRASADALESLHHRRNSSGEEADSVQARSRPPVRYARLNQPPYAINNNNEHADLEYRTIAVEALHHGDIIEYDVHNLYGHMEGIATFNALRNIYPTRKPFILSRSTFPGSGQYIAKWTGDNRSTVEDMRASIAGLLNFQIFGISMVGADIGGFGGTASEELLIRWHQLGAFYPFMRNHNRIRDPSQEPYISPALIEATRASLKQRYRLLPHWYTLFYRSHRNGHMVCSPIWVLDPTDSELLKVDDQFLVENRSWSPLRLTSDKSDPTETKATISRVVEVDAPLSKIPVHLRGGHILATATVDDTAFIETTRQVREAPLQILVALDETERAYGEYYQDDDSFEPLDGTLVKMRTCPGVFTLTAFAASYQPSIDSEGDDSRAAAEKQDTEAMLLAPKGGEGLRPTTVLSLCIWGVGLGSDSGSDSGSESLSQGRVPKDAAMSRCQVESHQVRVSIVTRPDVGESLQHRRELRAIAEDDIVVSWDAKNAQLMVHIRKPGGLVLNGCQGLEVDWSEALMA
ncbi:hypothetical protein BGX28_006229, partial [Mortierella sp. GBA30]